MVTGYSLGYKKENIDKNLMIYLLEQYKNKQHKINFLLQFKIINKINMKEGVNYI